MAYTISRSKSEKVVTYITPQGREARVTREVYLKENIPCRILICKQTECSSVECTNFLNADPIVILDGSYAVNFWEIFDFPEITGIIITLTSLNYVQHQATSRLTYNRIRSSVGDPSRGCVLFDNEFHQNCFRDSMPGETSGDYTTRLNWIAAHWYNKHLRGKVDVILLTENPEVAQRAAKMTCPSMEDNDGVLVMDLPTYLQAYHPDLTAVRHLYESLRASLSATIHTPLEVMISLKEEVTSISLPKAPKQGDVYPAHLVEAALLAGVRSGQFLQGILRVSRFRASTEAIVSLTDANSLKHQPEMKGSDLALRSEVMIRGMAQRNRAIDGDLVVIRILPRSQWNANIEKTSHSEEGIAESIASASECTDTEGRPEMCRHDSTACQLPAGFVVGILSRNWREYVCSLSSSPSGDRCMPDSTGWVITTPWDRRIPRIRIFTTQSARLSKERFVVRIDRWEANSNYPSGHFVRTLGLIGDLETETQTILVEHGLTRGAFTEAQVSELKPLAKVQPWRVESGEVGLRRDLRAPSISGNPDSEGLLIFSIDPVGCQDVDDALSVRWLEPRDSDSGPVGRRLQLGVHIADVAHFVPFGGHLDREARRRSTSVYLADRRYDMLPGLLSGDICSLMSGVDRYAMSVIWELDPESLEVLDIFYGRTVIRSSYKLSYEAAQTIADLSQLPTHPRKTLFDLLGGLKSVTQLVPELATLSRKSMELALRELMTSLSELVRLASHIRSHRLAKGGLELESVEVSIKFSDPENRTGSLEDISPKKPLEMNSTVAELMIFANHWVARRCLEAFPEIACLRRHPPPRPEFFEDVQRCAASRGFKLNVDSNKALSESLATCVDEDPEVNRVLRQLTTMAMTNALYFSTGSERLTYDQFGHYGLALNLYTHFTSPIRRYADIIVHRLLWASICASNGVADGHHSQLFEHEELSSLCRHMNEMHWSAQRAQRASVELFQALFFRDRPADDPVRIADAVICQLREEKGFMVVVPRYGIRGNIFLRNSSGQVAWMVEDNSRIIWLPSDAPVQISRLSSSQTQLRDQLAVTRGDMPSGNGQVYRLFDHITVRIDVASSHAHGLELRLELVGKPERSVLKVGQTSSQGQAEDLFRRRADETMIESVREMDTKRRLKRKAVDSIDNVEESDVSPPICDKETYDSAQAAKQSAFIAQLHTPSSFYHRFRKLIMEDNPVGEAEIGTPL